MASWVTQLGGTNVQSSAPEVRDLLDKELHRMHRVNLADLPEAKLHEIASAHKFASDYCYTVANGDIPTEGVMCANWLSQRGLKKVGMFWEVGSSGRDYADFFRDEAIRLGTAGLSGGCSDGIQDSSKGTEIGPNNEFAKEGYIVVYQDRQNCFSIFF